MQKGGENQRSWKGQTERVAEPLRHRWQMESATATGRMDAPLRNLRRTLGFFLFLCLGMLSAFVYLLLHAPIKTPLITVGASNYVWPIQPNSWVKEDVDGLASLHGKAIHWKDSSKAWQTKSTCLEDLQTQLRESSALAKRAGAIVLYFNMHGAVNEDGEPCLIPPAANCIATTQWIKIDELVSTIVTQTPAGVKVLLAFDCVHQRVDWNVAQLNNTFVDRLEDWATKSCPDSVVVLSACSPDQRSWSGPDLHNSIFGRELRLGLAGEADRLATSSQPGTGNGDGEVSMKELAAYLSVTVDRWTLLHRGTSQTPSISPKNYSDFRVTWALKNWELANQNAAVQHAELAVSNPSSAELDELWRTMDELRSMALYQYDPKSWAALEQKLLWLEQLAISGAGYAEKSSKQVFPALSKRLKETLERAKLNIQSNNAVAKANILEERSETIDVPSHLPSLALQEYLGEIPMPTASTVRARVASAVIDKDQTVQSIIASLGLSPQVSQWNELNFLGLSKKYDCISNWPDHTAIQNLFQLRDRCEQSAVQGDVRGQRWRRPAIKLADLERRNAEDQLFLGPGDSILIETADAPWTGLNRAITDVGSGVEDARSRIESALRLRDQGFAEIGFLANWICYPETTFDNLGQWSKTGLEAGSSGSEVVFLGNTQDIDTPFFREELAIQELQRLIGSLHELSEVLSAVSENGDGKRQQLDGLVLAIQRDFDSLKGLVRDHIQRANRNSMQPADVVREVDALLKVPFITAEERVSLRKLFWEKLRENVADVANKSLADESSSASLRNRLNNRRLSEKPMGDNSAARQSRFADRLRNWGPHPLGELLLLKGGLSIEAMSTQADTKANDKERELTAIDVGNTKLRRCFQSMQLFGPGRIEDWCQSSGVRQTFETESNGWSKLSFAEQYERAIASLCPIQFESNSTSMFRRLAFKDLLLWYANRTIDDFYADAMNDSIASSIAESYFERSVKQVLEYASPIQGDASNMVESARATRERIQTLGPIARNGIRTAVKLGPPGPDADKVKYEVNVMPTVSSKVAGKPWKLPIPEGLGTLLVRNVRGITPERRVGVSMPVNDETAYKLTSRQIEGPLTNEAVLVYRGHEFRAAMSVGQGIVVDFKPNHLDRAEVVLFGETKRQASIVFVLDCSWSMGEEIPVEAIAMKSQSKLELAKESVLRMVTQLASRPDARLGVRLFGHRLGWSRPTDAKTGSTNGKTQILPQPNYPDAIPNDLVPSRDVEAILPLGRFSNEMVGGLANKLSKIVPWGQSPLYLSIIESLRDFDADDDSTAKSIVVITDGDNFQFNASGRPGGEPAAITSIDAVYRAWGSNRVPLFVLGVGVSDAEKASARKNLVELAERTNGKYYDIDNGSDLLRALSEQLSLGTFVVSKFDSKPSKASTQVGEAKLNAPVELQPVFNEPYEVSFQSVSKSVQFQGGESLELVLTEDGQDIVSKPYDRSSPRAATLLRAGQNGRIIARVHRPSQRKNGVQFPISVQDPDSHFTPRPSQIWVEVTPVVLGAETRQSTYHFYDANFEPKTPVPLVSWNASNWPAAATAADVRIWVKYDPTPNLQSIGVEQLKQNLQRYSEGIAVNGVEGVKLSVNLMANRNDSAGLSLQVTESHSDRSKGVGSLRVGLETEDSLVPARVTRHFEAANSMAVHTFEFDASNAEAFLSSGKSRVCIQSRSAVHEGAWQLQSGQPIRVEVTSVPESLPQAKLPTSVLPR
jgi:Caspase domain